MNSKDKLKPIKKKENKSNVPGTKRIKSNNSNAIEKIKIS